MYKQHGQATHNAFHTLVLAVVGSALLAAGALAGDAETAEREIQYLIQYVSDSGCTYTRNGTEHASADAADHLRLKYRRGKRYADTAEHFIDRLASESSWTGRAYSITCDGVEEPSGQWLHRALDEYRKEAS